MNYLRFSKKRKQEADRILKETDLFNKLKKFGKVKQIGSYFLDLMVKPDLDFGLRVKKNSEINNTIKSILEMSKEIEKISFKKIVDRRKFGLDGKSLHLYYHGRTLWGIDIFVSTNDFREYNKLGRKVKEKITPKKKRDIIKLKYYFFKSKKKVKNIPYCIYISVLEGKVRTLKDLHNYLKENDGPQNKK
jgi:hypothetical protein